MSRLNLRRRVAIVLSSLAVAAATLLAFAALASQRANRSAEPSFSRPQGRREGSHPKSLNSLVSGKGVTPLAPSIAATLADDILLSAKKNPGDTITYTAVITNNGTDATGVVYNDTLDTNTTQTGVVTISPLAINDGTYQSIGNMTLTSANLGANCGANSLRGVTCNDTLNGASLVGFGDTQAHANNVVVNGSNTSATSGGGTVTLNTDGTFVYDPAAGFEGSDSFWYTLSNTSVTPNLTDNAQVTINVGGVSNGMVWFVNSSGPAGTGHQANPFNSLSAFNGVNNGTGTNPAAGDTIFLLDNVTSDHGPATRLLL